MSLDTPVGVPGHASIDTMLRVVEKNKTYWQANCHNFRGDYEWRRHNSANVLKKKRLPIRTRRVARTFVRVSCFGATDTQVLLSHSRGCGVHVALVRCLLGGPDIWACCRSLLTVHEGAVPPVSQERERLLRSAFRSRGHSPRVHGCGAGRVYQQAHLSGIVGLQHDV